jgi:tetratricopeptide (TPR) repeat protein
MTTRKFDDKCHAAISELESFPTFTPFNRGFYRLLAESMHNCGPKSARLRRLFMLLLRIETRRHNSMLGLHAQDVLDVFNLSQTTRKTKNEIQRVLRALMGVECNSPEERLAWQLMLSECRYHQGEPRLVVAALRRAVAQGANHPLVHFALGYNLYCHAMRAYTRMDTEKQQAQATNPKMFVQTCRQAIAAFRVGIGLNAGAFDAQLYWWIGFICEILAEKQAARRSYREAARIDPDNYAKPARERLARLNSRIRDAHDAKERKRLSRLPPITEDEMAEASRLLGDLERFPFEEENA